VEIVLVSESDACVALSISDKILRLRLCAPYERVLTAGDGWLLLHLLASISKPIIPNIYALLQNRESTGDLILCLSTILSAF